MRNVYVYVMETMADWEAAHLMAELNSRRFFKKDAEEVKVITVSTSKDAIHTMGGLTVVPDITLDQVNVAQENLLILPGSDAWADPKNFAVLGMAKEFLEAGGLVAGICGATVALANMGILDDKKHTSNGAGFLNMFCPEYKGTENYIDEAAVRDSNLITAAGTGAISFAKLILEYLDVFKVDTLDHWFAYFSTGNAGEFFAMLQSIQ